MTKQGWFRLDAGNISLNSSPQKVPEKGCYGLDRGQTNSSKKVAKKRGEIKITARQFKNQNSGTYTITSNSGSVVSGGARFEANASQSLIESESGDFKTYGTRFKPNVWQSSLKIQGGNFKSDGARFESNANTMDGDFESRRTRFKSNVSQSSLQIESGDLRVNSHQPIFQSNIVW